MLFNSYEYIFAFLPIAFLIYFVLNSRKLVVASKVWLIFSSLFFYGYWNVLYLPLIISSVLVNFLISRSIMNKQEHERKARKYTLILGLVFNVSLLAYFKYVDFFIGNVNLAFSTDFDLLYIALPLAISFFTLQQIAYLVDCYEGLAQERKFLDYFIFVTFFPQLIAGPIVHHKDMMPQFARLKNKIINYENIAKGIFIFSIGLFKKVVIADTFAQWATPGFDTAETLTLIPAWIASLSYTFQLYFDFSGYTDMAIGSALLFNIRLPKNFNSPYQATGMIEFWQRWHITLSNFISTYLYTPIVRSFDKVTLHNAMFATFITFLIAGLWHGASWMFVIFGAMHGLGIIVNQYWKKSWKKKLKINIHKALAWFITFNYVNISFVFFRANDMDDAIKVLKGMFGMGGLDLPKFFGKYLSFLTEYGVQFGGAFAPVSGNLFTPPYVILALLIILKARNSNEMTDNFNPCLSRQLYISIIFAISVLYLSDFSEFLYFNF